MKKSTTEKVAEAVIEIEESENESRFALRYRKKLIELIKSKGTYLGGILLVSSSFVGNVLNFFFNAYLGRLLSFENFALIGLMGGFRSFASILFGAFSTTSNYRSAFLIGKFGEAAGYSFWKFARRLGFIISLIVTLFWIIFTPFLTNFFDAETPWLVIMFGIIMLVGLANGADRGLISARLNFTGLALLNIFDPVIRLAFTFLLIFLGLKFWTFSAIPLSILGTFVLGWILVLKYKKQQAFSGHEKEIKHYPYKFFGISILTGFSSVAFSTFDILLANHYLSSVEAGKYTLLSLVGKMIYFLGGLTTPFIIPLISRLEGANKNSKKTMYLILLATTLLTLFGFFSFGVFGFITIPFLYGKKALAITPYLVGFAFGMMCYAISKVLVNYYLVKKVYSFTIVTSLLVFLQIILIGFYHSNSSEIASVMTIIWSLHLVISITFHFLSKKIIIYERFILAFVRNRQI